MLCCNSSTVLEGDKKKSSNESVSSGDVFWLWSAREEVIAVRGRYNHPEALEISNGGDFVPAFGLTAENIEDLLPASAVYWQYEAADSRWLTGFFGELTSLSDAPATLSPGKAVFVHINNNSRVFPSNDQDSFRFFGSALLYYGESRPSGLSIHLG